MGERIQGKLQTVLRSSLLSPVSEFLSGTVQSVQTCTRALHVWRGWGTNRWRHRTSSCVQCPQLYKEGRRRGGPKMAEEYVGETTFSPTNSSQDHLDAVQIPQNNFWMLSDDTRHPERHPILFERRAPLSPPSLFFSLPNSVELFGCSRLWRTLREMITG